MVRCRREHAQSANFFLYIFLSKLCTICDTLTTQTKRRYLSALLVCRFRRSPYQVQDHVACMVNHYMSVVFIQGWLGLSIPTLLASFLLCATCGVPAKSQVGHGCFGWVSCAVICSVVHGSHSLSSRVHAPSPIVRITFAEIFADQIEHFSGVDAKRSRLVRESEAGTTGWYYWICGNYFGRSADLQIHALGRWSEAANFHR